MRFGLLSWHVYESGVLVDQGVTPGRNVPARLNGFELYIRPRVNLRPALRPLVCLRGAPVFPNGTRSLWSHLGQKQGGEE